MHLENVNEDDMQISVEGNSIRDDAMEFVAEVGLFSLFISCSTSRVDSLKILRCVVKGERFRSGRIVHAIRASSG